MKHLKDITNWEDMINEVVCGDCLEAMKKLPDNSVDLIITDPPYGDGSGYGRFGKTIENNEDESINYPMIAQGYRILKPDSNMYIFTNWKFEVKLREFIEDNTDFVINMLLVIVKNNIGMGYAFRNQHEFCLVLSKGKPEYNSRDFSNVMNAAHVEHDARTHPHQKELSIIQKLILHSSNPNDIILDGFMGTWTTARACKDLERRFIGFEIEEKFCKIGEERLKQQNLF